MAPTAEELVAARDAALNCHSAAVNFRLLVTTRWMEWRRGEIQTSDFAIDLHEMFEKLRRIVDASRNAIEARAVADHIKTANAKVGNLPGVVIDGVPLRTTWHESSIETAVRVLTMEPYFPRDAESYIEEAVESCRFGKSWGWETFRTAVEREWAIANAALAERIEPAAGAATSASPKATSPTLEFVEPDTLLFAGKRMVVTPDQFRLVRTCLGDDFIGGLDLADAVKGHDNNTSFASLRQMAIRVVKRIVSELGFDCEVKKSGESLRISPLN